MLNIGLDWGSEKHAICSMSENRRSLAQFEITNDLEGIHKMVSQVEALGFQPEECAVALEGRSEFLILTLSSLGFTIYPLNPKALNRYRDRHKASGATTDREAAYLLADILVIDRHLHNPWQPSSPLGQEIAWITRDQYKLTQQQTRLSNQLTACLKQYYPVALDLFTKVAQPITLAFLEAYPTPRAAQAASYEELQEFFRSQSYPRLDLLPQIYAKLQGAALIAPAHVARTRPRYMLVLARQLKAVVSAIKAYHREIQRLPCAQKGLQGLLDEHPDGHILRSLPGAGDLTAARLLGLFGDQRSRFCNPDQIRPLAGTCPVTLSSGKKRVVVLRRACSKMFRDVMQQLARNGLSQSGWAAAYYGDQIRRHPGEKSRCLRALANRWVGIIYKLCNDRLLYDEQTHLRNCLHQGHISCDSP